MGEGGKVKSEDMIGNTFGRLKVLGIDISKSRRHMICQCKCGTIKSIRKDGITNGRVISCGCFRRNDLTGKKFGKLTVIKRNFDIQKEKNSSRMIYECRCDCGNITNVRDNDLTTGNTTSCGCYHSLLISQQKSVNLTGQKFNKLTDLGRNYDYQEKNQRKRSCWDCLCDCGNKAIVESTSLIGGNTTSCGCNHTKHGLVAKLRRGEIKRTDYNNYLYEQDPLRRLRERISTSVRQALLNGKQGGRTFDYLPYTLLELKIHFEERFEKWMSWNNIELWSIDHIIPQSMFPYEKLGEPLFLECWSLSNLRPLGIIDNCVKHDALLPEFYHLLGDMPACCQANKEIIESLFNEGKLNFKPILN